jgi:hypothetical protein
MLPIRYINIYVHPIKYLALAVLITAVVPAYAEHLSEAINVEVETQHAAIKSQDKINGLSDKTRKMLDQYRSATHQVETLTIYNKHLNDLLHSQEQEKTSLEQQLKDIEVTQREIVPLIISMLDSLEKFIALDLPFLSEERTLRLTKLKEMILRADVTNAEKFRRIIEAYQIENEYGNTIEAYRADLNLAGEINSVDYLRLRRVALYYQRFDGSETGYWNKEQEQWITLSSVYRNAVRDGLRIARKETAPDLLTLPIPAAEAGK